MRITKSSFKNNASFVSCISKINNTLIDSLTMQKIYMLWWLYTIRLNIAKIIQKQEDVFGITTEMNQTVVQIICSIIINCSIKDSKFFDYKTSITGKLEGKNTEKEVEIVVPLKHLSNFWRTLDMPLINCEINLILAWSENCALTSKATRYADPDADPAVAATYNPTNATFKITYTKFYVPVATLSTENDKKF